MCVSLRIASADVSERNATEYESVRKASKDVSVRNRPTMVL
jgi:hypothetical protein